MTEIMRKENVHFNDGKLKKCINVFPFHHMHTWPRDGLQLRQSEHVGACDVIGKGRLYRWSVLFSTHASNLKTNPKTAALKQL